MIQHVRAEDFPAVYPDVARFFASFVERAHGGLMPGFLEGEVLAGRAHTLVAVVDGEIKACGLCSFAPNGAISMHYCAGEGREDWQAEMLSAVEALADERGVSVEITCRPGWVRAADLPGRGYRETHRVMERRANG